jgi:cell division cycle 14
MEALFVPVIRDFLFLCDPSTAIGLDKGTYLSFNTDNEIVYHPFADDFGPYNLANMSDFMSILHHTIKLRRGRRVVYSVPNSPRSLTNGVFLLGSYMIIELGFTANEVSDSFSSIESKLEMYRDAQHEPADFRLELVDCWRGLERANNLRWIEEIDLEEYSHYNNPIEGDLHALIPDKLIAFRGPLDLPDAKAYADIGSVRFFAPSFYVEPFLDMGVTTVIRLNSRPYDTAPFEAAGIRCVHIDLDEGSVPPPAMVLAFLDAVAVHCREGLGRTGTLAAAHLMVAHGFSAREAMGWVRIMRPGSIVGEQQRFLCRLGDALAQRAALRGHGGQSGSAVISAGVIDAVESLAEADDDDDDDDDDDATYRPSYDGPACQPAPRASSLTRRSVPAPFHSSGGPRCSSEEPLEERRRERKRPQSSF